MSRPDTGPQQSAPARRAFLAAFNFVQKLGGMVVVLWAAASFTFVVQSLLPGDKATLIINMQAGNITSPSAEELAKVNALYGFDQPLLDQYLKYIGGLLHGDLGLSYYQHTPVLGIIAKQIVPTLVLSAAALVVAWILALLLTVFAAGSRSRWSRACNSLQVVLAALPPYWIGTIMLVIFAIQLHWFPVEGRNTILGLVLPTLSLALPLAGWLGQVLQDEYTRVLEQPFVTTARMRGMSELGVRVRHVLRHSILPGITLSGWAVGKLFSGAVLIEAVFARQGIGGVLSSAAQSRDIPVVCGVILVSAAIYLLANLVVDRLYPIVDPRITFS